MFIEYLQVLLPIIIYILLIVILSVGIVLVVKAIQTMNKVDKIVTGIGDKVESLNGFFHIIDFATDRFTGLTDRVVDMISGLFTKVLHKNKNRKEEE